ncbi:hypothetical protein NtRootA1_14060 [Arthrobacter sp. NtRootA1]|nr:hypothetical protein NtRootA1_14060 [Arthrobacter sp. NtRootA1]
MRMASSWHFVIGVSAKASLTNMGRYSALPERATPGRVKTEKYCLRHKTVQVPGRFLDWPQPTPTAINGKSARH